MNSYLKKSQLPVLLGTTIEYYDISLYTYMAPILVPIFFPEIPPLKAYFYYFLFELLTAFSQLLGASFFGKMGDTYGRKRTMYIAILSTSIITFVMSILPTYQNIGMFSTILFLLCRALQSFFLGGEYYGGAIYCLEHEPDNKKHCSVSGLYCSFTVLGIILASFVATMINLLGHQYFRLAYAISFLLAIVTFIMRRNMSETPEYLAIGNEIRYDDEKQEANITDCRKVTSDKITNSNVSEYIKSSDIKQIQTHNSIFVYLTLIACSIFFGLVYGIPTRLFNVLLPIAVGIKSSQLMFINTIFLVLYMVLLTYFGRLADTYSDTKIMISSLIVTILFTYPLMLMIETKQLIAIIIAKGIFATIAAMFISPLHSFNQKFFNAKSRYYNISKFATLGKCFNVILIASSFKLFEKYNNLTSIGIILISTALLTLLSIILAKKSYNKIYSR